MIKCKIKFRETFGRNRGSILTLFSQSPAVSIDREHFNLELIYAEVTRSEKLASMIVCNSETIREALWDAILKHDFRFLDSRVIVELFYALRNETSAGGVDAKVCKYSLA